MKYNNLLWRLSVSSHLIIFFFCNCDKNITTFNHDWNNLDMSTREAPNLAIFRGRLWK